METKEFLIAISAIQIAALIAIFFDIPILRPVIVFVYISFIPGRSILRALKFSELTKTEIILFSVGLSIATALFTGIILNSLYPIISKPLTLIPFIGVLTFVVFGSCILVYFREKAKKASKSFLSLKIPKFDWKMISFLLSLPVISIIGALIMNVYKSNFVLMLLIVLISIVPVLVGFKKIPKNLYPLAIVTIALALLFHNSLISNYLVEWGDSSWEYYFASLVLKNSFWNSAIPINYNAMPGIVILAPLFAEASKLDLTWVFKIFYTALFSLVPLGLYEVVKRQIGSRNAVFSVFLFMAISTFYTITLGLARFQIAAMFLVLLLLIVVRNKFDRTSLALSIVFSVGLIISHYALSSIFLLIAVGSLVSSLFLKNKVRHTSGKVINEIFVMLFAIITLVWAYSFSSGSILQNLVTIGKTTASSIFQIFSCTGYSQGLLLLSKPTTVPLHELTKFINLLSVVFISVGIVYVLIWQKKRENKINGEFLAISLGSFAISLTGLLVPYFSSTINTDRLYDLNLIFLSLYFSTGGLLLINKILNFTHRLFRGAKIDSHDLSPKILAIFLLVFLLINSGLIYEIAHQPINVPISFTDAWQPHFTETEVQASIWIGTYGNAYLPTYADLNGAHLLMMMTGSFLAFEGKNQIINDLSNCYIFLGQENIKNGTVRLMNPDFAPASRIMTTNAPIQNLTLNIVLQSSDKIFDDGNAQIYDSAKYFSP